MIRDRINQIARKFHVQYGTADVFGEDSDKRKKMDDSQVSARFVAVWEHKLEPGIRNAPVIEYDEARDLMRDNQASPYVLPGFQYRYFSLEQAFFLARLNKEADEQGDCTQLWSLGSHRDPLRLCLYFSSAEDRNRFAEISRHLAWEERDLGLKLLMDFVQKFSRK